MNAPHDDISDMPYYSASDEIPDTLTGLFKYIARYFLPELEMNVETLNNMTPGESGTRASIHPKMSVLGFGGFKHGDVDISCAVRPMRFYMLQRVTDYFAQMNKTDQSRALTYLEPTGLTPLLTLSAKHRIIRQDFQEIWA